MKQSDFVVDDIVYDFAYGWGVVKSTQLENVEGAPTKPICVEFGDEGKTFKVYYEKNGSRFENGENPTLSFAHYDFENGGFLNINPERIPELGVLVYYDNITASHDRENSIHWKVAMSLGKVVIRENNNAYLKVIPYPEEFINMEDNIVLQYPDSAYHLEDSIQYASVWAMSLNEARGILKEHKEKNPELYK